MCQKLLAKLLKLLWGYIYISKECRDFDIDSGNIFSVNDLIFHLERVVSVWRRVVKSLRCRFKFYSSKVTC